MTPNAHRGTKRTCCAAPCDQRDGEVSADADAVSTVSSISAIGRDRSLEASAVHPRQCFDVVPRSVPVPTCLPAHACARAGMHARVRATARAWWYPPSTKRPGLDRVILRVAASASPAARSSAADATAASSASWCAAIVRATLGNRSGGSFFPVDGSCRAAATAAAPGAAACCTNVRHCAARWGAARPRYAASTASPLV